MSIKSFIVLIAATILPGVVAAQQDMTSPPADARYETAIFAGGCFWCVEADFDAIPGVVKTVSGYTGGHTQNPTYTETSAGGTGHAESVEVTFDPAKITYKELVDRFWHNIDPTTLNRQFCDSGDQYRTAIFYNSPEQKRVAEQSRRELEKTKPFKEPIVTEITQATTFYPAEDYHQDYHDKNPLRYKFYRYNCGRDQRLEELWGRSR
jgi:peptide-methionine (S)-S-oxide reductase